MAKCALLSFYTETGNLPLIPPMTTTMITAARTQLPVRPHRLWIDPAIAPSFNILDLRTGCRSCFLSVDSIPATRFCVGSGERLDGDILVPGMEAVICVENVSEVAAPFRATWAAIIVPQHIVDAERMKYDLNLASIEEIDRRLGLGSEDRGSRIQHVPSIASRSASSAHVAAFGWDPYPEG